MAAQSNNIRPRSLGSVLGTWVPIGGALAVIGGAIINFFIQIHGNSTDIESLKSDMGRVWTQIKQEHDVSEQHYSVVVQELNGARDKLTTTRETLKLIETQLCAESNARNLMHSKDLAAIAPMFHKLFGEYYPTDSTTYPTVGECK